MRLTAQVNRWVIVLGVVSLLLLVNLLAQFRGVRAGSARLPSSSTEVSARLREAALRPTDELSRYDPMIRLDLLKALQDRVLPEFDRNPFVFEEAPAPPPKAPAPAAAPPQPPPPPPVTLKAMGYSEKAGGVSEAYVSDEDQVSVVHEGDTVSSRYKIVKITPTSITVEDSASHQTVELPMPQ